MAIAIPPAATSAEDIRFHYDIGNDFYALWLDETMTYSAGLWDGIRPDEADALARSQRAKFVCHLDLTGAKGEVGDFHLLDIGCGWGGLMDHALSSGRVTSATGLTLSDAQRAYIEARAHPDMRVDLTDWQSHRSERRYDAIVSVEAFEHFVAPGTPREERVRVYAAFFERCHGLLRPGGRMSLQTGAYDGVSGPDGPVGVFISNDIFPGGSLPRLTDIAAACDPYFSLEVVVGSAADYAMTLNAWSARLLSARRHAKTLMGDDVVRRYRIYLRACETTFARGAATLYRIGLRRRDEPLLLTPYVKN